MRVPCAMWRHPFSSSLTLNGEKDSVFRSSGREFARARLRARIELIPRARHLANFDDPDAFTSAVCRFAVQLPLSTN